MDPTDHEPTTFDVMPVGDQWEIRDADGRTMMTFVTQKTALNFVFAAAMGNRPAKARLLAPDGKPTEEWDYPA